MSVRQIEASYVFQPCWKCFMIKLLQLSKNNILNSISFKHKCLGVNLRSCNTYIMIMTAFFNF